jgi:hypothetical protein
MTHPQSSPRGLFAKNAIMIGNSTSTITYDSTGVILSGAVKISALANAVVSGDSTGIVIVGGVKLSKQANAVITGNTTGVAFSAKLKVGSTYIGGGSTSGRLMLTATSVKPSARSATARWAAFKNTTGVTNLCINVTGTTWKYVTVTSVLITS